MSRSLNLFQSIQSSRAFMQYRRLWCKAKFKRIKINTRRILNLFNLLFHSMWMSTSTHDRKCNGTPHVKWILVLGACDMSALAPIECAFVQLKQKVFLFSRTRCLASVSIYNSVSIVAVVAVDGVVVELLIWYVSLDCRQNNCHF